MAQSWQNIKQKSYYKWKLKFLTRWGAQCGVEVGRWRFIDRGLHSLTRLYYEANHAPHPWQANAKGVAGRQEWLSFCPWRIPLNRVAALLRFCENGKHRDRTRCLGSSSTVCAKPWLARLSGRQCFCLGARCAFCQTYINFGLCIWIKSKAHFFATACLSRLAFIWYAL